MAELSSSLIGIIFILCQLAFIPLLTILIYFCIKYIFILITEDKKSFWDKFISNKEKEK